MSEPARHSGLTAFGRTGRTGRVVKRLAALAAGSAVLLSAAPPALAAAPGRTGFAEASADYPASVAIDTVTPTVAGQNDPITITGRVVNAGGGELKSAHAAVRVPLGGKSLRTRSDIALVASRNNPSTQDGSDLQSPQAALGDIGAGQSRPFTLQVTPADLTISKAGVYELAVDVWGGTADNERMHALGIARTFLPYNAEPTSRATQVATLWPLTHTPELVAQTMPDNDQMPVLRDDGLAAELAPEGRLYKLVTIGSTLPGLTWVVDPDLLDTVYAMTKPYRVQKPGTAGESAKEENTVAGTGKDVATAWLAKLRQAVAASGSEVVSLPYADPDIASIAHNGADLNGMDTTLRKAGTAGQVTAEGRLSVDVRPDVAWPYQGALDQQIAATARTAGDTLVLVDGTSMPEPGSLPYTPNSARSIGNGQTAVVADHTVSEPFQGDLSTQQAQTAATQRFLAETKMITEQRPQDQRNLLVMPPRGLTVGTATALAAALGAAQKGAWINQVKLDAVATAAPDPDANSSVPGPADYPNELRGSEVSGSALGDVMGMQTRLDQLMRILTQPQRVRGPFSAAMVRSMSTGWRDKASAGNAYRAGVQEYLDNLISAVKVPAKSVITLPGDNGTLLVSVKNDLNQAVGNLQLRLTSGQLNRLDVVGLPETVVLDATTSRTLRFPAKAQSNGPVQMTAQLWTTGPDPQPYGKAVSFTVEVTSVTQGVLYVIGGGVVLILLAAARFYLQRKKRSVDPDDSDPEADADTESGSDARSRAGSETDVDSGSHTAGDAGSDTTADAVPGPVDAPGTEADSDPESAADAEDRVAGDEKVGH
ncbi:DUF6049 family protein [Kitasatospora atroaurantiaca]|uniref:Secreted protein n=1 Tax=Kitasatospora atroaurantiaca TaxID=285545 RepID=A0A561ESJ5_9ACTN|nr:DUF6049 family protein [Kitasatospora atroaurantiaca]TWE18583.1 hypothetical protein FB465_3663 [Kitasatospora atroaurantiaca]